MPPGYGVDDGVGLLFAGTKLVDVVSARARGARPTGWTSPEGEPLETPIFPRLLETTGARTDDAPVEIAEFRERAPARRLDAGRSRAAARNRPGGPGILRRA